MAQIQLANFADSTLASGILAGDLSLTFAAASPTTTFPTVTGADWFYAVLVDTSANREIVKVTAHAAGTRIMTIVRAQEGTTALGFATGSLVSLRLTVQSFTDVVAALGASTSGIQSQSYTRVTTGAFGGTGDAMTGAVTPALATYPAGLRITGTPIGANTVVAPTLNVGTPGAKTIKKRDASGTKVALAAGDYSQSGPFDFEYDGTDFILMNPLYAAASSVTAGTIIDFAGTSAPTGYLLCPTALPAAISATTYKALALAIGGTWGAGTTTVNAGSFVATNTYVIKTVGTTDFTLIGAASNTVGLAFTATGIGAGSGSAYSDFVIPWFAADYAAVQANANVGTATTGSIKSHTHSSPTYNSVSGSSSWAAAGAGGAVGDLQYTLSGGTGATAGNMAAGVRVLKCVKY